MAGVAGLAGCTEQSRHQSAHRRLQCSAGAGGAAGTADP
ncbi:hypothetical protein TMHG_03125, partial [Mycobacterium tuberculosis SUMu008]